MPLRRRSALTWTLALLVSCVALGTVPPAGATDAAAPASLQDAFAAAAREFGVPISVLLALGYHQSRPLAPSPQGPAPTFELAHACSRSVPPTAARGRRSQQGTYQVRMEVACDNLSGSRPVLALSRDIAPRVTAG